MHLSLDTMSMVDDSCLSPSNFHEMGKGGGIAAGGRVHSIDVILGFSKDQEALLSPAGVPPPHKVDIDSLAEHEKQQEASSHPTYSGHLSSLRNGGVDQQQQYHGESGLRCWGRPIGTTGRQQLCRLHVMTAGLISKFTTEIIISEVISYHPLSLLHK